MDSFAILAAFIFWTLVAMGAGAFIDRLLRPTHNHVHHWPRQAVDEADWWKHSEDE